MNADVEAFLLSTVGGTTVAHGDLLLIGHAVLNIATAAPLMRHASPVGTTDYAEPEDFAQMVVCNLLKWQSDPEAAERLTRYVERSGWMRGVLAEVGAA